MSDVIDAHVHFWREGSKQSQWLDCPPYSEDARYDCLRGDFLPRQLFEEMASCGVSHAIHVQASNCLEDNYQAFGFASQDARICGLVAWAPLDSPQLCETLFREWQARKDILGIRYLINIEPDPQWILGRDQIASLELVAANGFAFDFIGITIEHLHALSNLARQLPQLKIVLDHLNTPDLASESNQEWFDLIKQISRFPNIFAKISGLNIGADWGSWDIDDLSPFLNHGLRCFGGGRLIYGSNWPVANLAGGYRKYFNELCRWVEASAPHDSDGIFKFNATEAYGIDPLPIADFAGGSFK